MEGTGEWTQANASFYDSCVLAEVEDGSKDDAKVKCLMIGIGEL